MKTNSKSPVKILFVLTIVIIGLLVAIVLLNNAKSSNQDPEVTVFEEQPPIEGQPILGEESAPVTIVEFGDFKCPACKAWGETVFPQLINDYVDTGKVKFSYINVLFHGEESQTGSLAAEAVLKQSPENYWAFHKAIFDEQPTTQSHDDLWLTNEKVLEIASAIPGIDVKQLQDSLENQTEMNNVNTDNQLVSQYNIQLTPTIMVNNIMLEDPFDYEKMKSLIEQELEGK
ncbi:DsbA family protein [Halalkalibacterium halodurans]|uniref:DsbA family protein n=1 Tax=Halalkalibacterium halodurans TaxID=86665 RepID=UPI0010677019|nr:DsbA family protein [Halalkalibacterium halodurans]TES47056.1 DsbA family protein [Halalkalibacterium halodurans]